MGVRSLARRVLPQPVVDRLTFPDLYRRSRLDYDRPIVMIYGNCQAEPLRRLLASDSVFGPRHQFVRVPPVHEITEPQMRAIRELLPRVSIFIAQPVRNDYRDMPLGTEQMVDHLSRDAAVLRFPVAYFEGPFPFHVYVHLDHDPIAEPAPITTYHDLRIMVAASRMMSPRQATSWIAHHRLDPDWVKLNALRSLDELSQRESWTDIVISRHIGAAAHVTTSFHTINHPTADLLFEIARQVLHKLNESTAHLAHPGTEPLGHLVAPKEPHIFIPLGADTAQCSVVWRTSSGSYTPHDVVEAHLSYYRRNPHVLSAGLEAHAQRWRAIAPVWQA